MIVERKQRNRWTVHKIRFLEGQKHEIDSIIRYELHHEKTSLRGFRPDLTQTPLYSHRRLLEAWNFGLRNVAKTKVLMIYAVTTQLICSFVLAYNAKSRFSHDKAHMMQLNRVLRISEVDFAFTEIKSAHAYRTFFGILKEINERGLAFRAYYGQQKEENILH